MSGLTNDSKFEFEGEKLERTVKVGGRKITMSLGSGDGVAGDNNMVTAVFLYLIDKCEKLEASINRLEGEAKMAREDLKAADESMLKDIRQLQDKVLGLSS